MATAAVKRRDKWTSGIAIRIENLRLTDGARYGWSNCHVDSSRFGTRNLQKCKIRGHSAKINARKRFRHWLLSVPLGWENQINYSIAKNVTGRDIDGHCRANCNVAILD